MPISAQQWRVAVGKMNANKSCPATRHKSGPMTPCEGTRRKPSGREESREYVANLLTVLFAYFLALRSVVLDVFRSERDENDGSTKKMKSKGKGMQGSLVVLLRLLLFITALLLLMGGDVERNPGPPKRDIINVINSNISILTEIISQDLTYFSTKFIASDFVTQTATNDIRSKLGIGDGEKARQLLNRVTTNYKIARQKQEWVSKFVAVFSSQAAYKDLALMLTEENDPPVTDEEALAKALESVSLKQRNVVTVVTGIMGSGKTWLLSRLFRIKPPDLYTSTGVAEKSFRSFMRRIADISSFDLLTLDQILEKAKSSKEALVLELLHMIDTGGQPEFMEVMPCLIHNSDLTILVLDLTKSLDAYPTLTFHDDGTAFKKPIVSPRTLRQIIQQLACTMQAKRGKKKGVKSSKFLVIGTHKDCVDKAKLSEVLSALNKELASIFLPMMEKELIVCKEGEIMHAVNLRNPDSDDEKVLDSVRTSIVSAGIGVEIDTPLCLFMFEQDAIKYAEEQKGKGRHVMVLSLEECLQVGARLKMGREMVQAALIYFHRHNVFLYFRHILPNLVFLDPQVPLDFVNAIVRFSYKAKSGAIGLLTAQQIHFCSEGILTEELLQHECLSTSFIPKLYEPRHALNLFQHIFTIAPLSEDSSAATDSRQPLTARITEPAKKTVTAPGKAPQVGKTEYLMMCLLPDKSQSEIHDCLPSTSPVSPLLVRFSNGCAPNGSFSNTVSCLISSFKWKISRTSQYKALSKPTCLAHNIVTLRPHNAPVRVTLVNSTCYFEVHVNAGKAKDSSLEKYCKINSTIFAALRKVFETMQFDDIDVEPAFLCPCDLTSAHAATIFPTSDVISESLLWCPEIEMAVGELEWSHGVWFQDWRRQKQLAPLPTTPAQGVQSQATALIHVPMQSHPMPSSQGIQHQSVKPKERLLATEDRPTLEQLIDFKTSTGSVNVVKLIGTDYNQLGAFLLKDEAGTITDAIADEHHHNAFKVNYHILKQWIQGKGRQPVQWSTLIDVLKKIKHSELAKKIEDNLQ